LHSPKFAIRRKELAAVFRPAQLLHTWKDKTRDAMKGFSVRDPLDNLDFHIERTVILDRLSETILNGEYQPTAPLRARSEKSKGFCRHLIVPTPVDALVLQRLSDAIYHKAKLKAPTAKAFFERSDHRFNSSARKPEYGSYRAYLNFQEELFAFSARRKYIVSTDIANFFDNIGYEHLRNMLAPILEEKESFLDMLVYALSGLQWQPDYMPRNRVGLPQVNLDAPRLLANCFLYEMDEYLASLPNIDHTRYMDDIDVGVDTFAQAKAIVRDLDAILQTRQVRLNSGKTRILDQAASLKHFMIKENHLLDLVQEHITWKKQRRLSLAKERRGVVRAILRGLANGRFDQGNGEKVLKRLLSFASAIDARIPAATLGQLLVDRPSVRDIVLRHFSHRQGSLAFLRFFKRLVHDRLLIDDESVVKIARTVFSTPYRRTPTATEEGLAIARLLGPEGPFGFMASVYLVCKFGTPTAIVDHLQANEDSWRNKGIEAKFAAFAGPFAMYSSVYKRFKTTITKSRNNTARDAALFLHEIARAEPHLDVYRYCKAVNSSEPLGANAEKIGMLIAIRRNVVMDKARKKAALSPHDRLLADDYFGKHMR
jgi:hypothetical protein